MLAVFLQVTHMGQGLAGNSAACLKNAEHLLRYGTYSRTPLWQTPLGTNILSLTQEHPVYSSRHGMCNCAVEHNVATFSELALAVCWRGRLSRG